MAVPFLVANPTGKTHFYIFLPMPVFRILLLCLTLSAVPLAAQSTDVGGRAVEPGGMPFRLMAYNVENFFDTHDDSLRLDDDFLPSGSQRWTPRRFAAKAGRLARVLLDAGGLSPIDVVGLCEVEGDSALHTLFRRTRLARLGYRYLRTDGDDVRGMNVAIAWQPSTFHLVGHAAFSVPVEHGARPTRQVLLCSGQIPGGDTLDVLMIHLPSRRGGRAADRLRQSAVAVVRGVCDSLQRSRQCPRVIVMGDCNASPGDACLRPLHALGFSHFAPQPPAGSPVRGTYFFRSRWDILDQLFAFGRFPGLQCRIFVRDYLLEPNADGVPVPFRTYRGPLYHGGYSDHLPILAEFWLESPPALPDGRSNYTPVF